MATHILRLGVVVGAFPSNHINIILFNAVLDFYFEAVLYLHFWFLKSLCLNGKLLLFLNKSTEIKKEKTKIVARTLLKVFPEEPLFW